MTLFVDSSAFYAAVDRQDTSHQRAVSVLAGEQLVTTDAVLVESWLLMQRRVGPHVADAFWGTVRSGAARVECLTATDLETAWQIGEHFADQAYSITDRTSFAVMERLGIHRVASFDSDFLSYRFGRDHGRSFEVLR